MQAYVAKFGGRNLYPSDRHEEVVDASMLGHRPCTRVTPYHELPSLFDCRREAQKGFLLFTVQVDRNCPLTALTKPFAQVSHAAPHSGRDDGHGRDILPLHLRGTLRV